MDNSKCPCGAPVASWRQSPLARSADLCKPCCDIYLSVGMLCEVKTQTCPPLQPAGKGDFDQALREFERLTVKP